MTPARDAQAVIRLLGRERALKARLAATQADLRPHAQRLCDSAGYRVLLSGPALERLAVEKAGQAR